MNLPFFEVSGNLQLELRNASFTRQNQVVLSDINWQLNPDENWVIFGEVGAGKTTFIQALMGKLSLYSGRYDKKIRETDQKEFQPINQIAFLAKVALVSFQQTSFFNYGRAFYQQRYQSLESELAIPTVQDLLLQAAVDYPTDKLEQLVQILQLRELLPLQIIKLSNGQTRKLQIALALLHQPYLLILDNPFTGLDTASREDLYEMITLLIKQGVQVLMATNKKELPAATTHVLWLENQTVKGTYSRDSFNKAFLVKDPPSPSIIKKGEATQLQVAVKSGPSFSVAVRMQNVTIRYQNKIIIDNISWTVNKGDKWALVGPNGSGKSTLLSLIYADNPQAFANNITLFDRRKGSGESIWDIKKRIGYVSPEWHLYFRQPLTGMQVAATGFFDTLILPKKVTETQQQLIADHFAYFNRSDLLSKPFLQLSAGEQRLILLIRSLVKNPDLIIWDEPFQGLSPEYISQATSLLAKYCTEETTLILVSHYANEVPEFVTNYIYLKEGKEVPDATS